MTPLVLGCVMCAAVMHACWNAVLRGGRDPLWSMTLMMMTITVVAGITLVFVPLPNPASWPYVIASAIIHIGYNLSLVRTYRSGDLGQTYPVSRGSSPVLVALAAAFFAQEKLDMVSCFGVALVSGGILSLAFQGRKMRKDFLPAALTTGVLIGAYTVVDGIGVRLSGNSVSYTASMFFLWSITMPVIFFILRRRPPTYTRSQTVMAMTGGVVSLFAYGIVIWAMQYDAMGVVSALRETSVLFAALLGKFFLKETLTIRRMASCFAIAIGAACLVH
ncbi:EamA family transporter [Phyllobacterium endophyticum]|uniref:EamA family transporter n=1 Tax=Phyllobacterium endophyticum TaxID=1149773 RepID=A0A2P7AQZ7_9HYPH|nr:EamA family transporter [Phyllobacterium endophyticum]MBB3237231.1 putative membrane protein [Phyllobacterium endophyticum]PSH56610.1 EamA family transporter [Phyllobacterium endophyticum]TYR44396.1 EamA family transporter [Phyllobacterium endophyticum]